MSDPLLATAEATEHPFSASVRTPAKLYAISDLHLSFKTNRAALEELAPRPDDGLIICGDVGETPGHLRLAFSKATSCFKQVWWVPGNHELYTLPSEDRGGEGAVEGHGGGLRGVAKYDECVRVCREWGVLTPEDEYITWPPPNPSSPGDAEEAARPEAESVLIAPIFTLYDYSFRPANVTLEGAVEWAKEEGIEASDEVMLHPDPYPTRQDWCAALVARTFDKLDAVTTANPDKKLVIVGHWPLRQDLVKILQVPRFCIWCGTTKTEDWHERFNAKVVVTGHLHVRRTDWRGETRFEEVSLGYPRQWKEAMEQGLDVNDMLREILPGPEPPADKDKTIWRRFG
ncbi:metallophosphoesteras-like protein [Mytilinidion resinicola]|uniref:Metallophosphoesteras-like protein n=1 Tax=Mytilinidion resinicola TaxID=574789 RepID=A0A6A6YSU9_9PEZI|nr:metallophosphoesteras-like protein [Mytilinidion resinicola]KAF2811992.1 metallophosphoesteras-like protein [Mytilinidion resinicola]